MNRNLPNKNAKNTCLGLFVFTYHIVKMSLTHIRGGEVN